MKKGTGMYSLSILLSVLCYSLPFVGMAYIVANLLHLSVKVFLIGFIFIGLGVALMKPRNLMRNKYREMAEYDEYGRNIKKGVYKNLSRAERDAIDLQKTAEMERILDSTAIKKMTKPGSKEPSKDMEALIGLVPVKKKMQEMVARMEFEKEERRGKSKKELKREMEENQNSTSGRHMVFYGSPGTGKTTVARIITGFLYEYGYIKNNKCIEIDGNFLKMGAQGESATKTELIIREAYGGVLFIDEAYALYDGFKGGNGEEVISTLIKRMEDSRGQFILIMAGYTEPMKKLLNANPGFASRIKEYLNFPDYDTMEMREIFRTMANQRNFTVDADAFDNFDERIRKERALDSFGNGRTARNILDEAIDKHALNLKQGLLDPAKRYVLSDVDISIRVKN